MAVKQSSRERLLISLLFPLAVLAAFHLHAADRDPSPQPIRSFDVQSQDLAAALIVFAEQAGVQVAMKADSVHGLTAHAVVGNYSARQALEVLIDGLGLRANWVTSDTVTIAPQEVPRPVPGQATEGRREAGMHIEEVVVTARRQAERLQSVPVTISAFDSEALRRASIAQTSDLMMKVPGVFLLGSNNRENPVYAIRGQSKALSGTGAPAVVSYFAEVPSPTFGSSSTTYDMSSVQVLKGPQGTLFGRNTTGGAVLYYPTAPGYEVEGYVEGTFGRYDDRQLEGAITLPIRDDFAALRIAGQYNRRDGYTRNLSGTGDLDDIDSRSLRLSLLVEPSDSLRNDLIVDYYRSDDHGSAVVLDDIYPDESLLDMLGLRAAAAEALAEQRRRGPRSVHTDIKPVSKAMKFGITNRTEWLLGEAFSVVNIFGYRRADLEFTSNVDGVGLLYSTGTSTIPAGTPFQIVNAAFYSDVEQYSNELQIKGEFGRLSWIAGAFYLESEPVGSTGIDTAVAVTPGSDDGSIGYNFTEEKSQALFVNGMYDLDDFVGGLKFNAGFRYTWDEIISCTGSGATAAASVRPSRCTAENPEILLASTNRVTSSAPTWSVGADWQATEDVFTYLTTRRGYRAGGVNSPTFSPVLRSVQTYAPETVTDVELGVRTDWHLGQTRLRLNASAFIGYYDDIQINISGIQSMPGCVVGDLVYGVMPYTPDGDCNPNNDPNGGVLIENGGSARISGFDYDIQFYPTERLALSLGGSFLETATRSIDAPAILAPYMSQTDITFILAAERSFIAGAAYRLPLVADQALTLSADYYWTSERPLMFGELESYELVNLRAVWSGLADQAMEISAFVSNLFDKNYSAMDSIDSPALGLFGTVHGAPRQYGVSVRYRFGD
ncbi:MAG: TonB-dependent receptor [Porticoccaceae bacterium]